MTGKCVRDVERYQALLSALLQETENRECADCAAKGPRWASWNIGVFVCIRCAGIHRNLGVHISRVKSVNLDQWTQEQIQCMQEMGNRKANRLYEYYLPDNFRRPQADLAVESFIREKYEKKKYLDRNIDINAYRKEPTADQRQGAEPTPEARKASVVFEKVKMPPKREDLPPLKSSLQKAAEPVIDLLCLDTPVTTTTSSIPNGNPSSSLHSDLDLFGSASSTSFSEPRKGLGSLSLPATSSSVPENLNLFPESGSRVEESVKKQLSKDSILSLYGPQAPSMPAQGSMFMSPAQMGYPSAYSGFPGMTAGSGLMSGITPPAMGIPAGYIGCVQPPIMGLHNGMVAHQAGYATCLPSVPQPLYGVQPPQQMQWNVSQVNHQMTGLNFYGGNGMMAFGQPMGRGSAQAASHTLTSQVWK